ncbi:hypothetical protein [Salipiger mucosus]|uniref:Uncharacterized protein n=1 Tax=Salipiger mucosus DSM 16094 TaxID=1123237 RepID=S9QAX7_9RHOB|nr:hypothetical protein [Salipiger mucosus]EPX76798.1 hypothetical protein Salmuc_04684 [Salipiger mucosus DSM 16094]
MRKNTKTSEALERLIEGVEAGDTQVRPLAAPVVGTASAELVHRVVHDRCWTSAERFYLRHMPDSFGYELYRSIAYIHTPKTMYMWSGDAKIRDTPRAWLLATLNALRDLPAFLNRDEDPEAEAAPTNWAIVFKDAQVAPEIIDDEDAARARFDAVSASYNCVLFKEVARG